jgi:Lanthionine synthetase C-like protein
MSAPARYFANDQPVSRRPPGEQVTISLQRIVRAFPPKSLRPGGGLYYGPTSIAFLFLVLAKEYDNMAVDNVPLKTWAEDYLAASDSMGELNTPTASKCGVIQDFMSYAALKSAFQANVWAVRALCRTLAIVTSPIASNEWLYGRAGYLYVLRLVKPPFAEDRDIQSLIDRTANTVIESILASPRPWKWHGKVYVGAAHGIIGIMTQIVLTNPSYAPRLEPQLDSLLQNQYESGNWPACLPARGARLVQFCHGAPGVVSSLLSIRQHFPNLWDRIDEAIIAGRAVIKDQGLLTKEPCLCHGISGNALALEGEDFEDFLSHTTRSRIEALQEERPERWEEDDVEEAAGMITPSDHPEALWCGEAGRAWAWAVADRGLPKRFLGYNDI